MKIRCFQNFECTSQTWFISRSPMVILFVLSHPFPSPRSWLWLLQLPSPRPPRPPRRALRTAATPCDCWRRRTAESDAGEVMSCLARFNDPKKDPIILIANDFGIQMEDRIMQNHVKSLFSLGVCCKKESQRSPEYDEEWFNLIASVFQLWSFRCLWTGAGLFSWSLPGHSVVPAWTVASLPGPDTEARGVRWTVWMHQHPMKAQKKTDKLMTATHATPIPSHSNLKFQSNTVFLMDIGSL